MCHASGRAVLRSHAVSLSLLAISLCRFVKYAENVRMSYKGVKLNPFEVLITGWRCSVWFLKPFQLFFFFLRLWTYTENRRAMWTFATWQHILSVNQTFSTSLTQTNKKKKKKNQKQKERKREKLKNTQTFTTWQFSLQTQYNYTHIIPVWLCSLS